MSLKPAAPLVPKVIDFGLAKAIRQQLTEQSIYTAHGVMVGAPLYMSPKQAEHNNLDVDSRTDVYSLGVILYELLTGSTPLEREQLRTAAYLEVLRLIKEVELPRPSTRLLSSARASGRAIPKTLREHFYRVRFRTVEGRFVRDLGGLTPNRSPGDTKIKIAAVRPTQNLVLSFSGGSEEQR